MSKPKIRKYISDIKKSCKYFNFALRCLWQIGELNRQPLLEYHKIIRKCVEANVAQNQESSKQKR